MKKTGRVILVCWKLLPCKKVMDKFSVVVSKKDEGEAKAKYKSMGYTVL